MTICSEKKAGLNACAFMLLFATTFIVNISAQEIQIGDYEYAFLLREIRDDVNDIFPESHIFLYADALHEKILFASGEKSFFAISDYKFKEIIFDMDGDGFATEKHSVVYIPYWVVQENSIVNAENRQFLDDLMLQFTEFSSDVRPESSDKFVEYSNRLSAAIQDVTIENRDLYYLQYLYAKSHSSKNDWSWYALQLLTERTVARYDLTIEPPVFSIFRVEHYIACDHYELALKELENALSVYPDNPVFLLYYYFINDIDSQEMPIQIKKHWLYDILDFGA